MGEVRRLRDVPTSPAANAETLRCALPSCSNEVPRRTSGPGRPSRYCSPECAEAFAKEKRAADVRLRRAVATAEQYGPIRVLPESVASPTVGELRVMEAALATCRAEVDTPDERDESDHVRDGSAYALRQAEAALILAIEMAQRLREALKPGPKQ